MPVRNADVCVAKSVFVFVKVNIDSKLSTSLYINNHSRFTLLNKRSNKIESIDRSLMFSSNLLFELVNLFKKFVKLTSRPLLVFVIESVATSNEESFSFLVLLCCFLETTGNVDDVDEVCCLVIEFRVDRFVYVSLEVEAFEETSDVATAAVVSY